jgi:nucleotide-binding universal stress UspA family protein
LSYAAYISKISDSEIVVVNVTEHTRDLDNVLPVTIKTNLQGKEEQIDISGNKRSVQLNEALREVIKETTAVCRAAGMTKDIIYEIREGNPADEIINVSTLMDFDLIVMGSRRIASAIEGIGSTTRKVAATVKIPLLIVQKQPRYKDEW